MNIKWEKIESERQLEMKTLKSISVEKESKDVVAIYLSFEDGPDIKICKSSDYSKYLNVFVKAPTTTTKEVTYVMARKGGTVSETQVKEFAEENRVRSDFESLGYDTWVRKETVEVEIDAFSDKEKDYDDIPF
jgi:hypothetical protein